MENINSTENFQPKKEPVFNSIEEYESYGRFGKTCMCPRADRYQKPGSDDCYMTGR